MKLKLFTALLTLSLLSLSTFAQNYKADFKTLIAKDDAQATLALLSKWKKASPNDPEMYVAYYNLYVREGLKDVLTLGTTKPKGDSFELKGKDGKTAGYLGSTGQHNDAYIDKGFKLIDSAIGKFPARLDMRFGKTYVLGKLSEYERFTQEIIRAIEYGQTINLKWTWTDSKPLDEPKEFMLSSVQDYVVQLFNAGDENAPRIKAIAETVLKYYPDHIESLSNLSIANIVAKDYAGAITPLLKAEKINPTDFIVLNNIAYCYSLMGDKPNAIKYYELVYKYGDDAGKKQATEKLNELRKS